MKPKRIVAVLSTTVLPLDGVYKAERSGEYGNSYT
jgi:hypothetical protein